MCTYFGRCTMCNVPGTIGQDSIYLIFVQKKTFSWIFSIHIYRCWFVESFEQCPMQLMQTLCGRRLANKKQTHERVQYGKRGKDRAICRSARGRKSESESICYGFTYEEFSMSPKRKLPSLYRVFCDFMATHRICAPFFSVVVRHPSSAAWAWS